MKTKNFSVTGAGSWAWDGPWNVLYYESGADAGGQTARIRVQSADGSSVDFEAKPGRQLSLQAPARGVIITSLTGNAISGKVSLGTGDIRDSSLLGTVEVIDGGKNRSLAGAAFSGLASVGAGAGAFPHVQLWNPAGSGKNVFLSQLQASANATSAYVSVRQVVAPLANLQGNAFNKRVLVANSTAELRYAGPGAAIGGNNIATLAFTPPGVCSYKLTEPLLLVPGSGVTLVAVNTPGGDLAGTFEFTEEAQ